MQTSVCRNLTWPAKIVYSLQTFVNRCPTWPTNIASNLHTSYCQCRTCPAKIVHSLYTLACRCQQMKTYIGHDIYTFDMACAHQASDVGKLYGDSNNAYTHRRGRFLSCNRRLSMAYNINQAFVHGRRMGLACAHLASDIRQ